ncbi:hypothetical protein FOBRF1_013904 [Fusarium oxysporum]
MYKEAGVGGKGGLLIGVFWAQIALSIALIGLRIYTRSFIRGSVGWDDVCLISTLACHGELVAAETHISGILALIETARPDKSGPTRSDCCSTDRELANRYFVILQFGRMILMCINAHKADNGTVIDGYNGIVVNGDDETVSEVDPDVNQDLMRFIGVTIISIICLTQFFSRSWGRKLNKFIAVVKIGFLIGVIIVALTALSSDIEDRRGNAVPRAQDWLEWHGSPSKVQFAKALLAVLFSFEGWENATFNPGEAPPRDGTTFTMFLYWVFGGSRLKNDRTPWASSKQRLDKAFRW